MDRILQRTPIEQADLPEALTLEPCIGVQNHINPDCYIRPFLTTSGCREALVQDFGNQSTQPDPSDLLPKFLCFTNFFTLGALYRESLKQRLQILASLE
jgi:hypothetical protein